MRGLIMTAFLGLTLLLTSCGEEGLHYDASVRFDGEAWSWTDTAKFETQLNDTAARYDLILRVDHDIDFAYQNLYVRIFTDFPDGSSTDQVLSLQLSGENGGWAGDCGADHCVAELVLSENIRLADPGMYSFRIAQYSREEPLPGIRGLQFKIFMKN